MEQLQVKLLEGTEDDCGNYNPGKFELLTLPDYYKYFEMPARHRPPDWEHFLIEQARRRAKNKESIDH